MSSDERVSPLARVHVSIGILAFNEEASIAETLKSIFRQSLLEETPEGWAVELVCIPNGCTDQTAKVAEQEIREACRRHGHRSDAFRVEVLDKPSKHNAWNEFVHRFSHRDASVLVLMDGDVRLLARRGLELMASKLSGTPDAYVCGSVPIKHVSLSARPGLLSRISMGATSLRSNQSRQRGETGFAGCLYAARACAARRIILPEVLVGEDSFLRALWVTNFFTNPVDTPDNRRVIRCEEATVLFEAYLSPLSVLKNLRRRMVGLTINSMLYDRLWSESSTSKDAGVLLSEWAKATPGWDRELIARRTKERGSWVIAGGSFWQWLVSADGLWRWFGRLRGLSLARKMAMSPVAVVGTVLHAYSCVSANRIIRRGRTQGLWFTTRTSIGGPRDAAADG